MVDVVPWSANWQMDLDPRLDPYRDRVAVLERDGAAVGHVLILTKMWSNLLRGSPLVAPMGHP